MMYGVEPEWDVGGHLRIVFFFDPESTTISKLAGAAKSKRGLWETVDVAELGLGLSFALNNFIVASHLTPEESDLWGGLFHNFSHENFTLVNDVNIYSHSRLTLEVLEWLSESVLGKWGVRNITHHISGRDGSERRRKTYISFSHQRDAIHFKLRWSG